MENPTCVRHALVRILCWFGVGLAGYVTGFAILLADDLTGATIWRGLEHHPAHDRIVEGLRSFYSPLIWLLRAAGL